MLQKLPTVDIPINTELLPSQFFLVSVLFGANFLGTMRLYRRIILPEAMLEQVEQALSRQDYRTARNLIKTLVHNQPHNDRVHFYAAQLQELTEHWENAETLYRELLQTSIDPKILQDSRRAIGRIMAARNCQEEAEKSAALEVDGGREQGLLIIESVEAPAKNTLAPKLAEIFQVDPYSARLSLPSRGWRLYRSGFLGVLGLYQQRLQNAEIPSFCAPVHCTKTMEVVNVVVFDEFRPLGIAFCTNQAGEEITIECFWPEVTSIVSGLLPVFEELNQVTSTTTRTTIETKPKVLDYVQMCDIHIPCKNLILRLCSQTYAYRKADGEKTGDFLALTSRENWHRLMCQISGRTVHSQTYSEFTVFAEPALQYAEMLGKIPSYLNLMRREATLWDNAFHLYSSLAFHRHLAETTKAELN